MLRSAVLGGLLCLAACGSDEESSPPPVPTLTVQLDKPSQTVSASDEDTSGAFSFTATYTGASNKPIYPKVSFDNNVLALDGQIAGSGASYVVKLKSLKNLSIQTYSGDVTFKLCLDPDCNAVYPGSTQAFHYTLDVKLAGWTMFQRNARHTAFVPINVDLQKIAVAWTAGSPNTVRFQPAAASGGSVYVTSIRNIVAGGMSSSITSVQALDSTTGAQKWIYDIGPIHSASGPTVTKDQVHVVTMSTSSSQNRIVTLTAADGQFVRNMLFAAQWSTFAQPTSVDRELYVASGYYGNVVYGYDLDQGTTRWTANGSAGRVWDGSATAADDQYVYYYSGNLDVFKRSDGSLVKSIADPFWSWTGYSYPGAPLLGAHSNAIAFTGSASGTPLVSYDLQNDKIGWRTATSYNGAPALAKDILYAASTSQGQLDAIDEVTGKVLWSWPLPIGEWFSSNLIATENILFFSTNTKVYAVSLAAHNTVWSAPTPGALAISPDGKLLVSPVSGNGAPAVLTAYSLR